MDDIFGVDQRLARERGTMEYDDDEGNVLDRKTFYELTSGINLLQV